LASAIIDDSLESAINESISIHSYDPRWPAQFEKEKARLFGVFSQDLLEIEHIGSTAVPGLAAKPIIDMMAGVRMISMADSLLAPLRDFGYATPSNCNHGLTDRRWLLRHRAGHRTHHLHLVELGSWIWIRTIRFREILRADPEMAKQYQALKYQLACTAGIDRDTYILKKGQYVDDVLLRFPGEAVAISTKIHTPY
jgi:GrpB-like predicted nucleotidyltransferase (UPF0157 family)